MLTIDIYSLATVPLEMFFNDTYLALGTAFLFQKGEKHFLITNWHNVTGKDPNNGKHLSNTGAEPNRLRVWWNVKGNMGAKQPEFIPIRTAEDTALWFCHPSHGHRVDVVALPISPPAFAEPYPINEMERSDLQVLPGMDIFVLGYPFGLSINGLPIWKRASIASEPELAGVGDHLHILIDTASRSGMSGSPVIRRSWGSNLQANGSIAIGGATTKFIGVYSGRIGAEDELQAQLGLVWPALLVDEIIAGQALDPAP